MEKVKLGDICNILNGYAFKSSEYKESGIRVIRITNVQSGYIEDKEPKYYSFEKKTEIEKYMLKDNDILISLTGNVGRVGLLKKEMLPAALNQRVACIRIKENKNISNDYIFNILNTKKFLKQCEINSKGIAQKNLSTEWLKKYLIDLPDFREQVKISNNLEKVQELIDLRKKQTEELNELIRSQFIKMFGKIKEKVKLGDNSDLITKGASPKWQGINYKNEGTVFITSENVRNGFIDISKPKYLDNKINEILPRSVLKRGDILINIVGASIGRAAIYEYDYVANINQAVALVRTQQFNPYFLITFLNSDEAIKSYNDMKKGGARDNLSLLNISNLLIPKVSLEEQNRFAEFVKQIDKQKCIIEKSLKETKELQESLMNKYFGK